VGPHRLSNILSESRFCHRGNMNRKGVWAASLLFMGLLFVGPSLGTEKQAVQDTAKAEKAKSSATDNFSIRASNIMQSPPMNKGEWGILIVDAATGETLYERNADSFFVPASNMKLFTTALALDKLGLDYRFRTTLETNGKLEEGILQGDLILVGRGDPNLSNRKFPYDTKEEFEGPPERVLSELVDQLAIHGVKQVSGDIVGDDSYFPRERYPDGWEIDDIVWEYGAAISAIVLNDNTVTLTVIPGEKAGQAVSTMIDPATPEFSVKNEVITVGPKEKGELRLTREIGASTVVVSGTIAAASTSRKLILAVQEPAENAASLLARLLADRGIKSTGKVRANHEPDPAELSRIVLAEHLSLRLGDTVKLVNKISQNLHTEVLLRTAARQDSRWAEPEDLLKFPEPFYEKVGIAPGDVIQTDGSGLSRHDMVTPRAVITLLQYAQKQSWFLPYYFSLPISGIDGTLTERMKAAGMTGKIHAKTGSVNHVRSLSGYADTANGRRLIFSFLSNNMGASGHDIHEAIDGLCLAMVEEFNAAAAAAQPTQAH
jgi:D-alanyl-D-alanine carboxypeptidase/D-alanyl-D-alanine-endopeptidase (penicillin-binding protein 4)